MQQKQEGQRQYDRLTVHLGRSRVNGDYIIEVMVTNDYMGGCVYSRLNRFIGTAGAQAALYEVADHWKDYGLIGLHALDRNLDSTWGRETARSVAV